MSGRLALNLVLGLAAVAALLTIALRDSEELGIEVERREPAPGIDEIRVHVAGAVAQTGVVIVAPGERVVDALALAGGLTAEADTEAINLSRRLVDEDQIVVPRRGERAALLDLNTATAGQLEALPGIGKSYASAILASRERAGPYQTTDDLVAREVIPARVYEQVRNLVRVR